MKLYEKPELDLTLFETEDIMLVSGGAGDSDDENTGSMGGWGENGSQTVDITS